MLKGLIKLGALLGALSVILGAFAAHTLKQILPPDILQVFETAVRYQFYHVFAILAVAILHKEFAGKLLRSSGCLFIAGMILFCGSLYGLCYIKYNAISGLLWVGAITPVGGICFIAGWLLLFFAIVKKD